MTTTTERTLAEVGPLARCCRSHPDWPTLAEHLLDAFGDASSSDVVRELRQAQDAAESVGLAGADALDIAETIARHQLMLLTGRRQDVARLDPETHRRSD